MMAVVVGARLFFKDLCCAPLPLLALSAMRRVAAWNASWLGKR